MLSYIGTILRTTARYWFFGKLVSSWDLKAHIVREITFADIRGKFPDIFDKDIDKLNIDELQEHFANNDMPQSTFSVKKGVHGEVEIPVSQVDIDPEWFSDIGVAENMLRDLIELDKATDSRVIKSEIVSSWSVAERNKIDKGSATDALLGIEPLNSEESIILYFHGGAFVLGTPGAYRKLVGRISTDTHLRCITIDYRKAPKHPFPAQLYDALISFLYLVKKGFKPENIILAGDSAGGHLTISFLHLLRALNMHKVRGAIAISPVTNVLNVSGEIIMENKRYDFLPPFSTDVATSPQRLLYKPGTKCTPEYLEEVKDPLISPVYGDFSDFPNILIQAGGKEILLGQSHILHKKVKVANPDKITILEEIEDAIHVPHLNEYLPGVEEGFSGIKKFVESLP